MVLGDLVIGKEAKYGVLATKGLIIQRTIVPHLGSKGGHFSNLLPKSFIKKDLSSRHNLYSSYDSISSRYNTTSHDANDTHAFFSTLKALNGSTMYSRARPEE